MPSSRSFRRGPIVALILLAVVAGVAFGVDRVTRSVVTGRIADRLGCAAGLRTAPSIDVSGLFLPQVLRGRFGHVEADATLDGTSLGDGQLDGARAHAELDDVHVTGETVRVGRLRLELTVGVSGLLPKNGRNVHVKSSSGLLLISLDTPLGIPATLVATPSIEGRTLHIEPSDVEVLGIRRPANGLLDRLGVGGDFSRELPALPAGLRYDDVYAVDGGLQLGVTGSDLTTDLDSARTAAGPTHRC